jgi:Bacteriophage holin of superfamily 6 (Holin_LLH)
MLTALVFNLARMVVAAVLPTAAALGVRYLNRRWNLQITDMEMQQVNKIAHDAVTAADQKFKHATPGPETNRQKLEFAVRHLLAAAERAGLSIDRQIAEEKIEAVLGIKRSQEQGGVALNPMTPIVQP